MNRKKILNMLIYLLLVEVFTVTAFIRYLELCIKTM